MMKTLNQKIRKMDQFDCFQNALKNFTGVEASEISKIMLEQSNLHGVNVDIPKNLLYIKFYSVKIVGKRQRI